MCYLFSCILMLTGVLQMWRYYSYNYYNIPLFKCNNQSLHFCAHFLLNRTNTLNIYMLINKINITFEALTPDSRCFTSQVRCHARALGGA